MPIHVRCIDSSFIQIFSVCFPLTVYLMFILIRSLYSIPIKSTDTRNVTGERYTELHNKVKVVLNVNAVETNFMQKLSNKVGEQLHLTPIDQFTSIFVKVDENMDQVITIEELSEYIQLETKKHINQGVHENYGLFMSIDKDPQNGLVSWAEYHKYFLLENGFNEEYAGKHSEKHHGLQRSLKELIARDKASWSEAARSDPETLTLDEFLAFRHPESSQVNLLALADELLEKLDRDGDEFVTEEEFACLQFGEGMGTLLSQGESERREEFRTSLDTNKDGKADRQEILKYIDPQNPRHAREEAETLVALADKDHDGRLDIHEIISNMELFLESKMINTAKNFHDEF